MKLDELVLAESIEDRGIFKALFVVGIPGAGKSYTVSRLKGTVEPRVVNTDRATEYLSRKFGKSIGSENWSHFKDDAHRITSGALLNYLNGVLPLFIDGTSNSASNILARAGILESLGYDVGMIFVDTSLETAKDRASGREERRVDPEFIEMVNKEATENKRFFKGKFKFFKELKNDTGELTDEVLIEAFRKVSGFFDAPIENPVGQRFYEKMKDEGTKYLMPDLFGKRELQKKLEGWYRS